MLNKFTSNTTFNFHGGIHPPENKSISNSRSSIKLRTNNILRIQINQSSIQDIEHSIKILVKVGDSVLQGEALTSYNTQNDKLNVPVHSPCDGIVTAIEMFNCGHASGLPEMTIVIQPQILKRTVTTNEKSTNHWENQSAEYLLNKIRHFGVVGLGGATFPAHIKQTVPLNSIDKTPANKNPATLIVNAMECEPYITCDDRLLRENASDIVHGALITSKVANCKSIIFAIEDNKPEAIQALQESIKRVTKNESKLSILIAPTQYPSGGEKQLIQLVTGNELSGEIGKQQRPKDINILVQNVATLFAVYQAIVLERCLTERLVTITGNLVPQPRNYWIPFGTPISYIISHLDISENDLQTVTIGGPLMGQKISDFSVPTSKKVNCLIFNKKTSPVEIKDCIRCGECESVCPIKLLPQQLYWFSNSEQWQSMESLNLDACIECGACDYVCPSNIPLVDYFRFAKSEIKHRSIKERFSEVAKNRFENRDKRLVRIKQARQIKQQKKAEDRAKASENKITDPDGKKSAILASLNRVKNKSHSGTNNDE